MQGRGLARGPLKPGSGFNDLVGLDEKTGGRSGDLDALAVYTNSFPVRLSPHAPAPGKLSPEAERGKALFFSAETKCATCHGGPYYTDSRLQRPFNLHDVGTGGGPKEMLGPKFDTPSLLGAYRVNGRPARHDEPPVAGAGGRVGGVPEVAALRGAAGRHAERGPGPGQDRGRGRRLEDERVRG
jgi:hypothetical protein